VFAKDGKPEKIHFKAKTDNGVNKLHLTRALRLPVAHPKHWFNMIPKKRDEVVRNFPMDHLGLTGHIPDDVMGKLHNRSVKITLDLFCKSTHHEAVGNQKAGKYSDIHQIRAGINHFCLALHCIWPYDYTGLVITEVLNEAHWQRRLPLTSERGTSSSPSSSTLSWQTTAPRRCTTCTPSFTNR
jgi:hypothetical protein